MNNKNSRLLFLVVVIAIIAAVCMCGNRNRSGFAMAPMGDAQQNPAVVPSSMKSQPAPSDLSGTGIDLNVACAMNNGTGLASSLLPREVATQEDFGQFAPEDILSAQNFLDPRQQIGFPETLGGALRNANQQVRADPPNPKKPYTWNNSTIVPDLMQRKICT
jgi:hypothetical protein